MFYTRNTLSHKMRNTLKLKKKKNYSTFQREKNIKAQQKKLYRGKPTASPSAQQITNKPTGHRFSPKKKNRAVQRLKKKKKMTNPQILTKGFIKINEITKLTLT